MEIKTKPLTPKGQRVMENDQVINTIQALLEGDAAITPNVSAKLTLAVVSQLYVMMQNLDKKFDESTHQSIEEITSIKAEIATMRVSIANLNAEHATFRSDIKELKETDIVLWAQTHPKMAAAIAAVLFLIAVFAIQLKDYVFTLLGFHF